MEANSRDVTRPGVKDVLSDLENNSRSGSMFAFVFILVSMPAVEDIREKELILTMKAPQTSSIGYQYAPCTFRSAR